MIDMKKETESILFYLKKAESLIASSTDCENATFAMVMCNAHEILTGNTAWATVMASDYDDGGRSHDGYMAYLAARCRECSGLLADYRNFFAKGDAVKLVVDRIINLLSSADKCIDAAVPRERVRGEESEDRKALRSLSVPRSEYEADRWRNIASEEFYVIKGFIYDFMEKNGCGENEGFPGRCDLPCPRANGLCQFVKRGMELGKVICSGD
jgi:hypothetical protein